MTDDDPAFHESRAYDGEDTTEPCPQCGSTDFWRDPKDSNHFYCRSCKYNWGGGDTMTEPQPGTAAELAHRHGWWGLGPKGAYCPECGMLAETAIATLKAELDEAWNLVRDREAQQRLDRGKLIEAEATR